MPIRYFPYKKFIGFTGFVHNISYIYLYSSGVNKLNN